MRRRFSRKMTALTAGLIAGGLLLGACADTSDDDGDESTSKADLYTPGFINVGDAPGDPVSGGTLTVADYTEARSLDPTVTWANGAAGGNALAAVFDTLMRYDTETAEFEPQLAEGLTSDDNQTWTLTLRDGVTFSDGTPLDAAAVVGSMERYQASRGLNADLVRDSIVTMSTPDDLTVVFELDRPWKTFPNALAGGPGMVMAPAAYADPENFQPIGAGPFTFERYAPSEVLVLKANPDYWGEGPYLDELRFVWLGADQAKMESLASGEVQVAFVRAAKVVEDALIAGQRGFLDVSGLGHIVWVNHREGRPGADPRVRQAINLALDPELYMQRIADGAGLSGKSMFAESSKWYTDVEPPAVNPDRARELLDEAKADGYDGKIVWVGQADQASQGGALAVKAMLEAVGFEVELDLLTNIADQTMRLLVEYDFDIAASGATLDDADPYSRLINSIYTGASANSSGYSSEAMDALIDELRGTEDDDAARDVLRQIEELWHEDVPGISNAAGGILFPWGDDVHGIVPTAESIILFDKAWRS